MNYGELNEMLSMLLSDSSNNFYTAEQRAISLNAACRYLNSELRILRNVKTIEYVILDGRVQLPADFVAMGMGVDWISLDNILTPLQHRAVMQIRDRVADWESQEGTPEAYILEGPHMYLYPAPTEAGHVRLSYVSMPNLMSLDTDLPFYGDPRVESYHEAIVFYAAWLLTLKDRDFEAATEFKGAFGSRFVDLKENLRHTGDRPQQVVWRDIYTEG